MNEIWKMRLFSLLSGTSQVTNEQMKSAYDCFMKGVEIVSQSEKDYSEIYRILNTTRIELAFLKSLHQYEQGENVLKFVYLQKALSFVYSELELLNLKIRYPEQFYHADQPTFESELSIIPKSKDLGIVALAEIVIALFLSKKVFQRNGKPAYLNQIAQAFETWTI